MAKDTVRTLIAKTEKLEEKIITHDAEITLLRTFRHEANNHIQNHNGKLGIIETQQGNIVSALEKLTTVVEDAVRKIGTIMTLKSMLIGGGLVFVPTVTCMFYLFKSGTLH